MFFKRYSCNVPADVPSSVEKKYCKHYTAITKDNNRLFLLAYDQKMEHLNKDFYGNTIAPDAMHPEHIFKIASQGTVGALAAHVGLIARYARDYAAIPYIAKLNGKTDLMSLDHQDPYSKQLWDIEDVLTLKSSGINICGIGFTIYLGGAYESEMLSQAAQSIAQAHLHGFVAILWIYIRGKHVHDADHPLLSAGATGVAASLGADFVKIKTPHDADEKKSVEWLSIACAAAGNTLVVCAGGEQTDPETFLATLHDQLQNGGTAGCAVGRNIFQRSLPEAIAMTHAINALVYEDSSAQDAVKLYKESIKK